MSWLLIIAIGLCAGILSGIVGFGSTTIVMPILVLTFGPKAAIPIMAIASVLGNFARIMVWWSAINWRAVGAFSLPAVPGAALGARIMLQLDPMLLDVFLGGFFIAMIPIRRWLLSRQIHVPLWGLSCAGAIVGTLTGIVSNTGPVNTPFFLAHGLVKGAFIGTEAMSSLFMFSSKSAAFRYFGALPDEVILNGLIVGSTLMVGAWVAKRFVEKLDEDHFRGLMDAVLFIAGIAMISGAFL